jgi:hypothetical protein
MSKNEKPNTENQVTIGSKPNPWSLVGFIGMVTMFVTALGILLEDAKLVWGGIVGLAGAFSLHKLFPATGNQTMVGFVKDTCLKRGSSSNIENSQTSDSHRALIVGRDNSFSVKAK